MVYEYRPNNGLNLVHAYGFQSRERDQETQLNYHRNRYYNSAIGRWISEDPIGFDGGDYNLNRFVGNGPTNATDPEGQRNSRNATRRVYSPKGNAPGYYRTRALRPGDKPYTIQEVRTLQRWNQAKLRAEQGRINQQRRSAWENRIVQHHSDPVYIGGNPNQQTTPMRQIDHVHLHRVMQLYFQHRARATGNSMSHSRDNSGLRIRQNFTREELLQEMAGFYNTVGRFWPQAKEDFFRQHPHLITFQPVWPSQQQQTDPHSR
jgi:RHS repeat-associated protein